MVPHREAAKLCPRAGSAVLPVNHSMTMKQHRMFLLIVFFSRRPAEVGGAAAPH